MSASERIRQFGRRSAIVEIAARLEIQPEVKTSAPPLAVQVGELGFKFDDGVICAGNVAGAAGADAHLFRGVAHRRDHVRVAAHAEIIVRAPDRDISDAALVMPFGIRIGLGVALEIGKHAIAALRLELAEGAVKMCSICVHLVFSRISLPSLRRIEKAKAVRSITDLGKSRFGARNRLSNSMVDMRRFLRSIVSSFHGSILEGIPL